jgi:hypothetical protein
MKPFAARIVVGIITSTIHFLILVPVFFVMLKKRGLKHATLNPPTSREEFHSHLTSETDEEDRRCWQQLGTL